MTSRPMQINIYYMITVLIFLLLQIVTVQSQSSSSSDQCSVSTTSNCDPDGIVNYSVSFKYNGDETTTLDFYDTTITFHWGGGPASDYTIGPSSYTPYVTHTKTDSNYYLEENGEYYVGYTVLFDNVSCSRKRYTGYKRVVFRNGSCYFEDFEGTNVPTNGDTNPPTPSPIEMIITPAPTIRIITAAPTKRITPAPTWAATEPDKTTSPPFIDINPLPVTPSPINNSGEETGSRKTLSPTITVERPTPTTTITTTNSPTPGEEPVTKPPVILMYNKSVPSKMILIHSNTMDDTATSIWKDVTETTIKNEIVMEVTKDSIDAEDVVVTIDMITQEEIESIVVAAAAATGNNKRRRKRRRRVEEPLLMRHHHHGRNLQQQQQQQQPKDDDDDNGNGTLEIQYTTTIQFPQVGTYIYDPNQLITIGFNSAKKEEAYIAELQSSQDSSSSSSLYFTEVNDIILTVDGKVVDYPDDNDDDDLSPNQTDLDGLATTDDNSSGEDNSLVPIVAGVVGGGLVILLTIILGVYYTKRQAKLKEGKDSHTTQDTADKHNNQQQQQQQQYNNAAITKAIPGTMGTESETKSSVSVNLPEGGGDFGVIETAGFDDVSTIGDPYMGDAVAPVIDSDNTVGESTMQSAQQEYYGVGGKRVPTGIDSIMSNSRFGGSTIGSNRMMFSDDVDFEDVYATPDGNNLTQEDNDTTTNSFQRITVVAPAGMLGIVLDNPHDDLPVVYAIKETSTLNGKVRVGDLLLNVDEIDCRGMSAHQISSFLSSRSKNPVRRLIMARSSKKQ